MLYSEASSRSPRAPAGCGCDRRPRDGVSGFAKGREQGSICWRWLRHFLSHAALLVLLSACAQVPTAPAPKPSPPSRLEIVNRGPCQWRIELTGASNAYTWNVAGGETKDVAVAPGQYVVVQTLFPAPGMTSSVRRFEMTVAAGQTYRWRLVAVFDPAGEATSRAGSVSP